MRLCVNCGVQGNFQGWYLVQEECQTVLDSPFLFVPARYDDEGVVDPVSFFFCMQLIVHLCSAEMAVVGRCFQDVRAHVPAAVFLARL